MDAMAAATAPFIFSNCNARAVHGHERNIRDDQIRACAATGGVVGVNGLAELLGDDTASSAALFRHLDHMVQLVGAEHVGLGLDYVRDHRAKPPHLSGLCATGPNRGVDCDDAARWL